MLINLDQYTHTHMHIYIFVAYAYHRLHPILANRVKVRIWTLNGMSREPENETRKQVQEGV